MTNWKMDIAMAHSPILLVDDNRENLTLLEHVLEWAGFTNVITCRSAERALQIVATQDPHLIVLDLKMPGMDGYQFLEKIRGEAEPKTHLPILVYTADLTASAKVKALEAGASDFITKPGDSIEITLKIKNFLKTRKLQGDLQNHNQLLEAKVQERTEHLFTSRREAVEVLARASDYRDDDTGKHSRRVGEMSARLASSLKMDPEFVELIGMAAQLHDVGKIGIPDQILRKPGKLSECEREYMMRHVTIGAALLGEVSSPVLQMAKDVVLYHHERWDGKGYLAGLSEEEIPLSARIVSVADAYDAMSHDRPYRKALTPLEAQRQLQINSGTQFDPTVVRALEIYLHAWVLATPAAA
jgi:putative two-component system response regulator